MESNNLIAINLSIISLLLITINNVAYILLDLILLCIFYQPCMYIYNFTLGITYHRKSH